MMNKTLVLGIGNPLMQDDGIGVYVVQKLRTDYPDLSGVEFVDGGTLSFSLIGIIEEADHLIVVDAAQMDVAPGVVLPFLGVAMDDMLGLQKNASVHDVTLIDLMSIALLADRLPTKRALVGIQPECIGWRMELSPVVNQAIPEACQVVMEIIKQWHI